MSTLTGFCLIGRVDLLLLLLVLLLLVLPVEEVEPVEFVGMEVSRGTLDAA